MTQQQVRTTVGEGELARRLAALSLEQKVRLVTGADAWALSPEPSVGLRRLVMSDGPAGVRGETWDERQPSANVPAPTALAATWDEALVRRLGGLLAFEARRKGVDVLLAPTVNLHRSPYAGRHFECFSEDPLLTARIGVAYVRGLQDGGVAATVKHFVANDSETERMTLDARVDERTLREVYLAPFEAIVRDAGAWAVMAAYNAVNGFTMTESPLLHQVLQAEWGFDGVTMSDWFATRSTVAAANAGLDLVMPGPQGPWGEALVAAVHNGLIAEATVDEKVLRLLRLAARVGALDGLPPAPQPATYDDAAIAAQLRHAAAAGFVLAGNRDGALPLARTGLRRVAVLGPNAEHARTLGGGSATVCPPYTVSPLEGLRTALRGTAEVTHAVGAQPHTRTPIARAPWLRLPDGTGDGVRVSFLAADGTVLAGETRRSGSYTWLGSFGPDVPTHRVARIRVHTRVRATEPGAYEVGCSGIGRFDLAVDGSPAFDATLQLPPEADMMAAMVAPPQRTHTVHLDADEDVEVILTHHVEAASESAPPGVFTSFQLNLQPPRATDEADLERAVALARDADVAVVVVGTNEEVESEGFDRTSLALPGQQDELVRRVAAVNSKTVVVVNSGAPVLLPWADHVAAILLAWFPGQEFGNALADVLLGLVEPGGRLPTTWPDTEQALPATQPTDGALHYDEGLHVGYRRHRSGVPAPRYPFGHGLGYTTWDYLSIDAPPTEEVDGDVNIAVRMRNSGQRPGREVVQVYLRRPGSAIERPARWLAGFTAVTAGPGEEVTATVLLTARAFQHWDTTDRRWSLEPGTFHLDVGSSAGAVRLTADLAVHTPTEPT
ncbi:beta-glucosidase [Saccharothrix deserti]|uniref:beta-glucosidase n=1 Tax=Saccharothrix deserti TaxID=2593674 RepID=UPI00131C4DCF|nr:glycoside hydrolase family 3 C-terminal domain-containing protein [Saccharothrix deserti]